MSFLRNPEARRHAVLYLVITAVITALSFSGGLRPGIAALAVCLIFDITALLISRGKYKRIAALSDEIKAWLKENFADFPWLAQYREWLDNPNYNIFYDANNVICVYGDTTSHWYVYDGTLCTANIMLAAHAKGIGSCWIGFAQDFMDRPEIKARYKVPEQCRFVSALSLGYAKGHLPEAQRKEPVIFNG